MQNTTRIALGLGAAAVVASGGSAFTAASSVSESGTRLGSGSHSVTGVTVSNIAYVNSGEDLTQTVFTVSGTALAATDLAQLSLNTSTNVVDADCDFSNSFATITCDLPASTALNSVNQIFLVVKPR